MSRNVKKEEQGFDWGKLLTFTAGALGAAAVAAVGYAAYQDHQEKKEAEQFYQNYQSPFDTAGSSSSRNASEPTQPPPTEEEPKKKCPVCSCDILHPDDIQKLPCNCNMHEKCFNKQGKLCTISEHNECVHCNEIIQASENYKRMICFCLIHKDCLPLLKGYCPRHEVYLPTEQ